MKCEFGRIECYCLGVVHWDGAWVSKSTDQSCLLLFSSYTGFPEYLAQKSNSCSINCFRPLVFVVKNTSLQGVLPSLVSTGHKSRQEIISCAL